MDSHLVIVLLALTAVPVGATLGVRFNPLILVPVVVVDFAAILGIAIACHIGVSFIFFVALLGVTGLQLGYFAGSLARHLVATTQARNNAHGFAVLAQRLFGQSARV